MKSYTHILVAADLSENCEPVFDRAKALADTYGARVTVLQVLEHFPEDMPLDPVPPEGVDKLEWYRNRARERLNEVAERFDLANPGIKVVAGKAEREILRAADADQVDLVIVGTHQRHGLALFRGATTDGVVHNAPCDVLAVHTGR